MTIHTAQQCAFCGYYHLPDYSDVIDTPQEWMKSQCEVLKPKSVAKTGDGRVHVEKREAVVQPARELPEPPMTPMPSVLHVKFKRIHGHAGNPIQAYRGDAGWDLEIAQEAILEPGVWQNLHTGITAAIPSGYWGHILARSSAWRHRGIRVEPAVIDSSYRGELLVYAVNTRKEPQIVKVGECLAQIVIVQLPNVEWIEQMTLPQGERGERGYGSSGRTGIPRAEGGRVHSGSGQDQAVVADGSEQ